MTLEHSLLELDTLAKRLRRDCPWDREQTEQSIVPHTVEEAYEVADAAQSGDPARLVDELGDLLYQVYFLALLLEEKGEGDLEQVARGIHEKLVRRHPHVFGDAEADTAGQVRKNWEQIKVDEDRGLFSGISRSLPGLVLARKVQQRASGIGFEYPDVDGALADLEDELRELREAASTAPDRSQCLSHGTGTEVGSERVAEPVEPRFHELGDVLFAAVNVARKLHVDPELALRAATQRFVGRVEEAERLAAQRGEEFTKLPLDEQDRYFDLAKETE